MRRCSFCVQPLSQDNVMQLMSELVQSSEQGLTKTYATHLPVAWTACQVELFCATLEKSFSRRKNVSSPASNFFKLLVTRCNSHFGRVVQSPGRLAQAKLLEKVRGDFLGRRWALALVL